MSRGTVNFARFVEPKTRAHGYRIRCVLDKCAPKVRQLTQPRSVLF
jgi:hypothetical protein